MKLKRLISSIIALVLVLSMSVSAFADTWYLEDGDITVSADGNGQSVQQGGNDTVPDSDTVITQRDSSTATSSTITISPSGDATADVTIKDINMRLSGENHDGEPENLTKLDIRAENGEFTVTASGEGTVEKLLYNGSETVPAAPGRYPVTVVLKIDGETVEIEIGTLIVPENPAEEQTAAEPLYRVTDKDGRDIAYRAERKDGVLTITVDADYAILTGKLSGIDALRAQGVGEIVFITNTAASTFKTVDLLEKGASSDEYKLTRDGETVTFVMSEKKIDVKSILVKP